jgi:Uma2 family endonuclease
MSTARRTPAVSRLTGVNYDVYVQLRDAWGNRHLRMAYHDGVLEIMSPEFRHEKPGWRLGYLVDAYADAFNVDFEPAGATTFRKGIPGRKKGQGKEPDASFYLGDLAARVRNLDTLDLEVDPPPSLWIEVDNRASSKGRLPLYAKLGVPEVWRYRPRTRRLRFVRLVEGVYEEITTSIALPGLTSALVLELLVEAETRGTSAWNRWLRQVWFPEHRQELLDRGAPEA